MAELNRVYVMESPKVLNIFAATDYEVSEEDIHASWFVGYAPERDEDEELDRVVICTAHTSLLGGRVDLTVAATLVSDGSDDDAALDDVAELIRTSHALESLWDFARSHLLVAAGMIEATGHVPHMSPEAQMAPLEKRGEEEPDGSESLVVEDEPPPGQDD